MTLIVTPGAPQQGAEGRGGIDNLEGGRQERGEREYRERDKRVERGGEKERWRRGDWGGGGRKERFI